MTLKEIMHEAETLSAEDRRDLIKMLVDTLTVARTDAAEPLPKKHSLRELRGLGKEIWIGIDAQEYINQQRDEWDRHP